MMAVRGGGAVGWVGGGRGWTSSCPHVAFACEPFAAGGVAAAASPFACLPPSAAFLPSFPLPPSCLLSTSLKKKQQKKKKKKAGAAKRELVTFS